MLILSLAACLVVDIPSEVEEGEIYCQYVDDCGLGSEIWFCSSYEENFYKVMPYNGEIWTCDDVKCQWLFFIVKEDCDKFD